MDAKKTAEEAYTMFIARLNYLFHYYVKSRQVNEEYVKMFDLMIENKLKDVTARTIAICFIQERSRMGK